MDIMNVNFIDLREWTTLLLKTQNIAIPAAWEFKEIAQDSIEIKKTFEITE